jgi:hypothetical protein
VHLGLSLHHEGLLAVSPTPRDSPADGTFLLTATSSPPTLLLAPLVAQHVSLWASESTEATRAALGYIWLLRADPEPRLDLAASLLLDSGRAAEALAPSPALGFIEPPALRSLVLEVASRLAGRGRVSQAARLLYQAREYATLASLLAEELSTAIAQSGDAPAMLRLASDEEPADAAARASRLRKDAAAFVQEWGAADPVAASRHGMPLAHLIRISELVDGALAWREAPRGPTGPGQAPSLPSLLAQLDGISADGLLPTSPATVDAANAEFRLQPPCVQVGPWRTPVGKRARGWRATTALFAHFFVAAAPHLWTVPRVSSFPLVLLPRLCASLAEERLSASPARPPPPIKFPIPPQMPPPRLCAPHPLIFPPPPHPRSAPTRL